MHDAVTITFYMFYGHALCCQLANANGQPQGNFYPKSGAQGFHKIVSVGNYLSPLENEYLVCTSEQQQIHCWMAAETGHIDTDIGFTSKDVNSWQPALAVVDDVYLSWIQNGTLHFGKAKK